MTVWTIKNTMNKKVPKLTQLEIKCIHSSK